MIGDNTDKELQAIWNRSLNASKYVRTKELTPVRLADAQPLSKMLGAIASGNVATLTGRKS